MSDESASTASARPRKPRRAARPCDACRTRKTRCIPQPGSTLCVVCYARATDCTYVRTPPRRRLPSIVSVSGHPQADGHESHLPNPDVTEPDVVVRSAQQVSPRAPSSAVETGPPQHVQPAVPLVWNAPYDHTLGLAPNRFSELYGLTSDMEPILMRHRPYSCDTHEYRLETHSIRRVLERDGGQEYPLTFHMVDDEKAIGFASSHAEVDSIEACVRPYGPRLLRLFWRIVQPCYPILHKKTFAAHYSESYRNLDAGLLGAVYLNAIHWWSHDSVLSPLQKPNTVALRRLTQQVIQNSYHRPRLSSIEAILLLLQCKPEDALNPDHTFVWGYVSQALAIAECLGLHLDASEWTIPDWEKSLRKRLSWALYMQDKWAALAYGRPSHIQDDQDWCVQDLTESDFVDYGNSPEEMEDDSAPPRNEAADPDLIFTHMIELTKFLSTILRTFYSARASTNQDTTHLFYKAQPILDQLSAWHSKLSPALSMDAWKPRQLCSAGNVHFAYYGLQMTILRRLVRSTTLAPLCQDHDILAAIRQAGRRVAEDTTTFIGNLRPDHTEAFWYSTTPYLFSVTGSFLTLLLVTSLSMPERTHWRESLKTFLWNLRLRCKAFESMRYAVDRLEGAILRGLEHALAVDLDESPGFVMQRSRGDGGPDQDFMPSDAGNWDFTAVDLEAFDWLNAFDSRGNGLADLEVYEQVGL